MRNGETHLRLQNASWIGQRFKSGDATGPLVLFIGFPGAILATFWWIGLRLTRPGKPSI
jgi:hypothetical protein